MFEVLKYLTLNKSKKGSPSEQGSPHKQTKERLKTLVLPNKQNYKKQWMVGVFNR